MLYSLIPLSRAGSCHHVSIGSRGRNYTCDAPSLSDPPAGDSLPRPMARRSVGRSDPAYPRELSGGLAAVGIRSPAIRSRLAVLGIGQTPRTIRRTYPLDTWRFDLQLERLSGAKARRREALTAYAPTRPNSFPITTAKKYAAARATGSPRTRIGWDDHHSWMRMSPTIQAMRPRPTIQG
jgi:hypothetical protein